MPDGGYPAVHHIGWGYHIGAGPGMGYRNGGKVRQRRIVIHFCLAENSAVPVGRIFTHADVRDEVELWVPLLQSSDPLLYNAVVRIGVGPERILFIRKSKEQQGPDTVS